MTSLEQSQDEVATNAEAVVAGGDEWYGKTWRYLRVAMVGLPLALLAAVVEDRLKDTGHCFQSSISGYYYTPVHGFLIGALVAVGVCLFCVKGRNPVENVLLNLAGMAAPVVAFVPTSPSTRCMSNPIVAERFSNAGNNMFALALLEIGALGVIFIAKKTQTSLVDVLGFVIAAIIVLGEVVLWGLFASGIKVYLTWIHNLFAAFLFVCLLLAVAMHAAISEPGRNLWWHLRHPKGDTWIVLLMLTSLAVFAILRFAVDWTYAVFQIEFCLLALFMIFWIASTEWVPDQTSVPTPVRRLVEPSRRGILAGDRTS